MTVPDEPEGRPALPEPGTVPDPGPTAAERPAGPPALTPEEQMEQFEESLKESDWGHQPC